MTAALEQIKATLCGPQARLDEIEPALAEYIAQHGIALPDPTVTMDRAGKYHPTLPACHVTLLFGQWDEAGTRALADTAWTKVSGLPLNWVTYQSFMEQYTGEQSARVHRIEWNETPPGSGITVRTVVA